MADFAFSIAVRTVQRALNPLRKEAQAPFIHTAASVNVGRLVPSQAGSGGRRNRAWCASHRTRGQFKRGMRAGAFGWRGSANAIERLRSANSEIRAINRADPVAAAEGVVALAKPIWPAFEHIDTSSGALGSAVHRTLEDLVPILISAPADEHTRAHWLERLREAVVDDGVDYLAPVSDRFGEIAAFPALINLHADRDLDLIRNAWADHARFTHIATATLTLSCLLEAGRHEELLALLAVKKTRLWFDEKFAAEALLRQGREDAALARAAALLKEDRQA